MSSSSIKKLLVGLTMCTPVLMMGCTPTKPVSSQGSSVQTEKRYSQAQVDLLVAQARADEQARINKVLVKQLKQLTINERIRVQQLQTAPKKGFERIKSGPTAPPQATTLAKNTPLKNNNTQKNSTQNKNTQSKNAQKNKAKNKIKNKIVTTQPPQANKAEKKPKQALVKASSAQKASNSKVTKVTKIIPESRTPVLYREIGGAKYYRCAANALVAVNGENGWQYSSEKQELSATLCKKSRDRATMTDLQYSLYEMGYLQSDTLTKGQLIDGIWGQTTLEALKAYQREEGLLLGQLTIQSLEHLGVFQPR